VTWLLLTGAGLVAETVVIVVLGRTVTARYHPGDTLSPRPDATARGSGRGIRFGLLDDDQGALPERMGVVRDANT
jgi:hypothetical protein